MKKLIHRVMAFSLSFLLAINTASAGRWFQSCLCPPVDVCPPMACGPLSCGPVVYGPVACGPTYSCNLDCGVSYYGGWEAAAVYQPACGGCNDCGSAPVESQPTYSEPSYNQPTYSEPTYSEPAYQAPAPTVAPALPTPIASEPIASEVEPVTPIAPVDAFSDIPEVVNGPADLFEELPAEEPAAFNEPTGNEPSNDLFDEVMPENEVAVGDEVAFGDEPMDAFGDEGLGDDAFGDEGFASEPAVEEELPALEEDNLFGEEPAEELMEEPADDFFGEEVADEPMDEPMDDAADDLFGEEPVDDFGADDFGDEGTSDEGFADEGFGDEAFSDEAGVEDTPTFEEEAPADEASDLFGDETAEDAGNLFGEEADDFGGAEDFAPADEAPVDEAAPAEGPSDDDAFDDLFGALGAILQEPGGYFATSTRTWVDNTGTFSCVGRLVAVEGSNIRLRKTNGTMTMVPLGRLSSRDLEFVNRQASAQYEVELIGGDGPGTLSLTICDRSFDDQRLIELMNLIRDHIESNHVAITGIMFGTGSFHRGTPPEWPGITDASLDMILGWQELKTLSVYGTGITIEGQKRLLKLPDLEEWVRGTISRRVGNEP